MDRVRFFEACGVIGKERERNGVGTLGEKTLHAVLKRYFEGESGSFEVKVGSFVADIVNEKGIFEIQTRGFERLRGKLDAFLAKDDVTVVYPVAHTKYLCWIDRETGEISPRRKSPKTGTVFSALDEMYKIKFSLRSPNLHFCFVLLELTEYRRLDGWSRDKKKGSTRFERIPDALVDEVWVEGARDYAKLVPEGLGEEFTVKEFAKAAGLGARAAQNAVSVLKYVGAISQSGKRGNAYIYERAY